jgi:hypothetical protein
MDGVKNLIGLRSHEKQKNYNSQDEKGIPYCRRDCFALLAYQFNNPDSQWRMLSASLRSSLPVVFMPILASCGFGSV